jgi:hypothetical protein
MPHNLSGILSLTVASIREQADVDDSAFKLQGKPLSNRKCLVYQAIVSDTVTLGGD